MTITENGIILPQEVSGDAKISITFENYPKANHVFGEIDISVVTFNYLAFEFVPYPTYSRGYSDASILNKIHCSDVYQQSYFEIQGYLNNGKNKDVTNVVTMISKNTSVVTIVNENRIEGVSLGTTEIEAEISGSSYSEKFTYEN